MLICVPLGPHLDVELLNHSGDLCSPGIDAANQFSKAVIPPSWFQAQAAAADSCCRKLFVDAVRAVGWVWWDLGRDGERLRHSGLSWIARFEADDRSEVDSVADKTEGESSQLFLLTTLLTPTVWLLSMSRIDLQLWTPTQCPTIQFSSDTSYLELLSGFRGEGPRPTRLSPLQTSVASTGRLRDSHFHSNWPKSWNFPQHTSFSGSTLW